MYAIALMLTLLIESVVALVWVCRGRRDDRLLTVAFIVTVNLFTHPLAWVVYTRFVPPSLIAVLAIEAVIIAVESAALRLLPDMRWRDSVKLAMSMNAASFAVGLILMTLSMH